MTTRYIATRPVKVGSRIEPGQEVPRLPGHRYGHLLRTGAIVEVAAQDPPEPLQPSFGATEIPGIDFASGAALEAAAQAGLGLADFEGTPPSGKQGYTIADVRQLVAAKAPAGSPESPAPDPAA